MKVEGIKLMSEDGMWLTNCQAYGKEVYLGKNDSVDNWHEITDSEYREYIAKEEEGRDTVVHNLPNSPQ